MTEHNCEMMFAVINLQFAVKWSATNILSIGTEIWEFEAGDVKIIDPLLPDAEYLLGMALFVVDADFCKK